ncbi:galactokinase [Psychroflexus sediminis]|uniref:Galactokinase n=1 Tax=Psychroflexus sediminis TaxID=470826 RepID=A0A1G7WDI3_9FLAO|nr:galactokinase [Psychroflexus sediminis]SDG70052.1 galactokinase [Psychroflexus sediminis]
MKEELILKTSNHFAERFNTPATSIFLSPGRINIIGEHVDYNDGFVLPAAIDKYICFAISPVQSDACVLVAKDLDEEFSFNLTDDLKPVKQMWANFILGGLHQLKQKGFKMKGFQLVFSSTIPIGAGLSSSAALECGLIYAINDLFSLRISKQDIALMGQQTSHTFVGVKCGIMDQFACVFGKKDKAIKLDCTTLDYSYFDADLDSYSFLLLDSNVKHEHLTSGYNVRREEVETGLEIIKSHYPEVMSFRSCTFSQVKSLRTELGENLFKRCSFVVKEIQRVNEAAFSIQNNNFEKLGTLMFETHQGLSKDYEVSCTELDFLVEKAMDIPGVLGARMMGGGFGGCSINLVHQESKDELIEKLSSLYIEKFNVNLRVFPIHISDGLCQVQ